MRILQVNDLLPGPGGGGAEVHLERLIAGLREAGDEVEVFAGEVRHEGVAKVLDVWDPWARRALARRVASFRPDVIHYHHVVRELSASVLGVGAGIPKVLTMHDVRLLGRADGTGRRLLDALQGAKAVLDRRMARRHVDLVVGVSEPLTAALQDVGFRRVVHLPSFADAPVGPAPDLPSSSSDIVFAGRLTTNKGVHQLVDAFVGTIATRHPETRLILAGDGPERPRLQAAAAAFDGDRIRLPGRLTSEEVARLFGRARLVCAPSIGPEGLPLVAAEAALAGRPLVVGDDPGLRSFVERCGAGVVVDAQDVGALAAALSGYLADPARADADGSTLRAVATADYTTAAVVDRLRGLYAELVGAAP